MKLETDLGELSVPQLIKLLRKFKASVIPVKDGFELVNATFVSKAMKEQVRSLFNSRRHEFRAYFELEDLAATEAEEAKSTTKPKQLMIIAKDRMYQWQDREGEDLFKQASEIHVLSNDGGYLFNSLIPERIQSKGEIPMLRVPIANFGIKK